MFTSRRHCRIGAGAATTLLLVSGHLFAQDARASAVKFNIEPQPLAQALNSWADQAGLQVIWPAGDPAAYQSSPRVHGRLEPMDALRVLLEDTGLTYSVIGGGQTVAIHGRQAPVQSGLIELRLAQAEPNLGDRVETRSADPANARSEEPIRPARATVSADRVRELEEIVVTGTHIRGASTSASPILTYDRVEIERTGVSTVQEFVQRLPQNFSGGASEDTIGVITGGGDSANSVSGTGVNLRGLGNSSTLVLLNGRRLAPGNTSGNFVDISSIPLIAVDRIEVVPDGASAVYGSDAVGGVINFILRNDFEGGETQARYGTVSSGSSDEIQLGQSLGHAWSGGSALLSYEYFDRSPLDARSRPYTQTATQPFTLLPQQRRHSAFAAIRQDIGVDSEFFSEGLFGRRSTYYENSSEFFSLRQPADIDTYHVAAGFRSNLWERAEGEVSVSYSGSDIEFKVLDLSSGGAALLAQDFESSVLSIDSKIDGRLFSVPAGQVLFALGAQYRDETFGSKDRLTGLTGFEPQRNVAAAFVELRVPLISELELSLAGRYEDYSDFGSSVNPKLGLVWNAAAGLKFRGTWSTSFRAPTLSDLNPEPFQIDAQALPDPASGGVTNALFVFGGNNDLGAEEAKSWSVGFDVTPAPGNGLSASVTYYDIEFEDQIVSPQGADPLQTALFREAFLGPTIIQRNPSPLLVQELASSPVFTDFNDPPIDLGTIGVIADFRIHNLATTRTRGIDASMEYPIAFNESEFNAGIDATYVLKYSKQTTKSSPSLEFLNTTYNPIDLKLRAHGALNYHGANMALFLNYVDGYKDNRTGTVSRLDSWTTVDATFTYQWSKHGGFVSGLSLMVGALNVFDEDPPFVPNSFAIYPINFDGANANALGRFLYVQLSKQW